ncbi:autophagy protein 5 [Agyrium rufum]|nr:autophagy protein 5 [Agyrium rufum]
MSTPPELRSLQAAIWGGSIPLEIHLEPSDSRTYDETDPFFIHHPRLSYLPFLLPKLHSFFSSSLVEENIEAQDGWFSFENVPLKWHYPLGLLYDLFSGAEAAQSPSQKGSTSHESDSNDDPDGENSTLPWRLVLHYSDWPDDHLVRLDAEGKVMHDAFINSVKEADFIRNGTAKGIMSLSKADSTQLWTSVEERMYKVFFVPSGLCLSHGSTKSMNYTDKFAAFNPIYQRLVTGQGAPLRNVPLRVYLPSSPSDSQPTSNHLKVVQGLIPPIQPNSRDAQTLGTALHSMLPTLFPSRRTPILAKPVLHGAVVPLSANVEELLRCAAYLDGWIHLGVMMIT